MDVYRKKPDLVEAYRWTAGDGEGRSLAAWCGGKFRPAELDAHGGPKLPPAIIIPSGGVKMYATPGYWIVLQGGEFFALSHEQFTATYERSAGVL